MGATCQRERPSTHTHECYATGREALNKQSTPPVLDTATTTWVAVPGWWAAFSQKATPSDSEPGVLTLAADLLRLVPHLC